MDSKQRSAKDEPTIAPSIHGHDPLEEKASADEVKNGEYTTVTKLFLDRTPED